MFRALLPTVVRPDSAASIVSVRLEPSVIIDQDGANPTQVLCHRFLYRCKSSELNLVDLKRDARSSLVFEIPSPVSIGRLVHSRGGNIPELSVSFNTESPTFGCEP